MYTDSGTVALRLAICSRLRTSSVQLQTAFGELVLTATKNYMYTSSTAENKYVKWPIAQSEVNSLTSSSYITSVSILASEGHQNENLVSTQRVQPPSGRRLEFCGKTYRVGQKK